ncbi:queuosine precursor transporter [Kaistia sp. K-TC2]|uniref:Probable queuosine precursor transporter n=2 Tax=Kaistiaceae TaxID=2831111 RepID=A0A9X3ING6_9HYPH|nr:queuosine precursor transporter [Kaistia nematophila]MBN9024476.1 queuosine precursor transporter [Hyphomicrobiales bacterium]MCX5571566.1 queuosine precursor transporter [Kaistia nematophila]
MIKPGHILAAAFMAAVVVLSNILVQYPVEATVGRLQLADLLTWGAFTYPFAFFVSDLTNRRYGPRVARLVVLVGFVCAVIVSFKLATPRLAIASGTAYLVGQLLDISLFARLRRQAWWRAPLAASVVGSVIDTAIFFTLAFAPLAAFLGPNDAFALESAPLLGVLSIAGARWMSWALGDLTVKLCAALLLLAPYRALMRFVLAFPEPQRSPA